MATIPGLPPLPSVGARLRLTMRGPTMYSNWLVQVLRPSVWM